MHFLTHFEDLIRTFNWHTPSWDLFIVVGWVALSVLYAFAAGKGRILSILVSVYIAKLLVIEAPFLGTQLSKKLNIGIASLQQLAAFLIVFGLLFVFLSRYAFRTSVDRRQIAALPFSILFALLQVGLLVNIVLGFLPPSVQANFVPLVRFLFIQSPANFVWLLAPIAFLIILGRFISEKTDV